MTAVLTEQPPINYVSKGAAAFKNALLDPDNQVWLVCIDQAPTDGTSGDGAGWAGPGSLLIDFTNAYLYINTGTAASPTWTKVGTQS